MAQIINDKIQVSITIKNLLFPHYTHSALHQILQQFKYEASHKNSIVRRLYDGKRAASLCVILGQYQVSCFEQIWRLAKQCQYQNNSLIWREDEQIFRDDCVLPANYCFMFRELAKRMGKIKTNHQFSFLIMELGIVVCYLFADSTF